MTIDSKSLRLLSVTFLVACSGEITGMDPPGDELPPGGEVDTPPPPYAPVAASLPRLTAAQYGNVVRDVFGATPAVTLEADTNPYLFYNLGAARTTLSERGVEQYEAAAHAIAAAVFADAARRDALVGCDPAEPTCTADFVGRLGLRLFRRPLSAEETTAWVDVAAAVAEGDLWRGLRFVVAGMLQAPSFLYRAEIGTPDGSGWRHLGAYEIASKLSFLLWNTAPDEALLDAAATGALDDASGVHEQALRLLEDPRSRSAIRAFFAQYLDLGRLDSLDRDPTLYPAFSPTLADSMRTEVELMVDDIVNRRDGDLRELFSSRRTFLNAELAALYGVEAEGATPITFVPVELPAEGPRAGLLTTGAFLAMNAHPSETSPTLRGKYVRERVLCQTVLPPPDDIDIDLSPPSDGMPRTLRERLEEHRSNPQCATCHAFMDPPGMLFEHFDSVGAWRDTEPGGAIDSSGDLDGIPLEDASDLATMLRDDRRVPRCVVRQLYRHTMGRLEERQETAALVALEDTFAASGYRFRDLLVAFTTSEAFRTVAEPEAGE